MDVEPYIEDIRDALILPQENPVVDTSHANYIRVYEKVLSYETCTNLISAFEKSKTEHYKVDGRPYTEYEITHEPLLYQFYLTMHRHINRYIYDCALMTWPLYYTFDSVRMKKYSAANQEYFNFHADSVEWSTRDRLLQCLFYLNTVDEGGETDFYSGNAIYKSVKPTYGTLVMFPAGFDYVHRARPPKSGDKYIASAYVKYHPGSTK